jgi:molybdenum-dependent DNA-binding transcriptional regulator ModE
MKKGLLKLVAFSFLVVTLASCAKAPQAEIDSANAAIEAAKTAGADRYVPESFNAASEALKSATTAVEEQNSKFALFRNYDAAKTTLASVNTLAGKAVEETTAKKAALKAEVTQALTDLAALITANKELLAKAPKGKEGKAALEAIGQEIAVVETVNTEVTAGLANNEDILTLSGKIKPAVEKAKAINTELTEVTAKAKGKGKKK